MEQGRMLSVTDLCAYRFCSRSLYIKLVLGFYEPAKPVMVLGSIRHKVFEDANKKEQELVESTSGEMKRQEVLMMFENAYAAILNKSIYSYAGQLEGMGLAKETVLAQLAPAVLVQAQERADDILRFASKVNLFGKELWDKLSPKIISEMRIESGKLRLKGIIDRIEVYGKDYVPVEIKTGKAPYTGVWPDHQLQVAAYMLLMNEKFSSNIREGIVRYVATNQSRQVVMNPFMEFEVTGVRDEVFSLLEKKELPKFCGKSYCQVCSYGDDFGRHLMRRTVRTYA